MGRILAVAAASYLGLSHTTKQSQAASVKNHHQKMQDFLVTGLEEVEPAFAEFQGKMYAGMIPFTNANQDKQEQEGAFMFWLFEPTFQAVENTLSIYLSGGPGCSSIGTGNFFGSGPVAVPKFPAGGVDPTDKDGPLAVNPYSWTQATTLLYVEQPATTGFSYGPIPNDEEGIARDMYQWLMNFLAIFDHLAERELFLWGGSYSGMNVPAIARKITHENKKIALSKSNQKSRSSSSSSSSSRHINLVGIALGNAWLDAKIQGPALIDYAWSHGMIDLYTRDTFHKYYKECIRGLAVRAPMHPFTVPDDCGMDEIVLQAAGEGLFADQSINPYDISTWDPYGVLGDDGTINKFYNNPKVQEALHAPPTQWYGCSLSWATMLLDDKPESVVPYVAELLDETDVRVLFWNGDRDLLCCHTGTELLLDSMQWSNASSWKTANRGVWMVNDRVAGYTKKLGNLQYVTVYNSGHMVYYNQPARALDLVKRHLSGHSLSDVNLPSYPRGPERKVVQESSAFKAFVGLLVGALVFFVCRHFQKGDKRKEYEQVSTTSNGNGNYQGTNGN